MTHTQLRARARSLTRLLFRFVLYANSMCYFHGDSQVPGGEIFFNEMAEVRAMLVCDCKHKRWLHQCTYSALTSLRSSLSGGARGQTHCRQCQ